ncbi:hypothetical protein ACNKHS_01050 [Shigella flexneri]
MEATAIARVCHNFSVPFVIVRAISDVADHSPHQLRRIRACGGPPVHRDGGNPGAETGAWVTPVQGAVRPASAGPPLAHRRTAGNHSLPRQYGTGVCRRDHAGCGEQASDYPPQAAHHRTGCHLAGNESGTRRGAEAQSGPRRAAVMPTNVNQLRRWE